MHHSLDLFFSLMGNWTSQVQRLNNNSSVWKNDCVEDDAFAAEKIYDLRFGFTGSPNEPLPVLGRLSLIGISFEMQHIYCRRK